MARPNKKGPVRTVDIYCSSCAATLFKYRKGGKGALVKCFLERMVKNHTRNNSHCPKCEQ